VTTPPVVDPAHAGAPVLAEVAAAHPAVWADLTAAWAGDDPVGDLIDNPQPLPHPAAVDRIVLPDAVSTQLGLPPRARRSAAPLFDKGVAVTEATTRIQREGT